MIINGEGGGLLDGREKFTKWEVGGSAPLGERKGGLKGKRELDGKWSLELEH